MLETRAKVLFGADKFGNGHDCFHPGVYGCTELAAVRLARQELVEVALFDRHVFPYDQPMRSEFE